MNTRAPCGVESIRNEPINDSFFVGFVFSTTGGAGSGATRIAGSAASGISDETGGTGAGARETGAEPPVNASDCGSSDVVSHETAITHTSEPYADPDANDQRPRRSFGAEARGVGATGTSFARGASTRRAAGRGLTALIGSGAAGADLIGTTRSEQNSPSGSDFSGAHRPLRSWLTEGRDGSNGCSGTRLGTGSAIRIPLVSGR